MTNEEAVAFLKKNVIPVACVIVSIAVGVAIYLRSGLLPDAEKVLLQQSQQAELLAANIEASGQLKEQHTALVSANKTIANRMIRVGQLAENLQYFYKLESDTGTKLSDPHQSSYSPPSKSAPKTNFIAIGFTLSAQGDYGQLIDLVRRLENGDHYCRINTLSLKPLGTDVRGGGMLMYLSLELMGVD